MEVYRDPKKANVGDIYSLQGPGPNVGIVVYF